MGLTGQTDRITPTTSSLSLSSYTSLFLFFFLTSSLCLYPLYGYDWPYMSTDNGWSLTKFSLLEWIILFFFGQEICYIRRLVVSFGSRGSTSLAVLVLFFISLRCVPFFTSPLPFIFTIFHDELHACVFKDMWYCSVRKFMLHGIPCSGSSATFVSNFRCVPLPCGEGCATPCRHPASLFFFVLFIFGWVNTVTDRFLG